MRPTPDEQLAGARRLLESAMASVASAAGPSVAPATAVAGPVRETLLNVQRLLDQVGRSWAALPGFYAADNAALATLLSDLDVDLPPSVRARVSAALAAPAPDAVDVEAAARHNTELRGVLSLVLRALPAGTEGTAARSDIGRYLRSRVQNDPT